MRFFFYIHLWYVKIELTFKISCVTLRDVKEGVWGRKNVKGR
jgi:hypothetical protein